MPVHVLKRSNPLLAVLFFFYEFNNSIHLFFFFLGGLENSGVSKLCCPPSSGSTWPWWPVAIGWRRRWSCSNRPCSSATGRCDFTSSPKNLWSPSLTSRWMCRNCGTLFTECRQTALRERHILFPNYFAAYPAVRPWTLDSEPYCSHL